MDELPEVLTRINTRLEALESRVALLEYSADAPDALPAPSPLESPIRVPISEWLAATTCAGVLRITTLR